MRRVLVGLLALVLALGTGVLAAAPAHAAGRLRSSDPGSREELDRRPGWLSLAFDGKVNRKLLKVLVVDSRGVNMVAGDLEYQGSAVLVQLNNDLPRGTYTVKYQVDRADGQPEGGSYQFAYGRGDWTANASTWSGKAQQPPEMANPDPQATGAVETPTETPPVVEVSDRPTTSRPQSTDGASEPEESASATPQPGGGGGFDAVPWLIGGVVLLAAAAGAWLVVRQRRR